MREKITKFIDRKNGEAELLISFMLALSILISTL